MVGKFTGFVGVLFLVESNSVGFPNIDDSGIMLPKVDDRLGVDTDANRCGVGPAPAMASAVSRRPGTYRSSSTSEETVVLRSSGSSTLSVVDVASIERESVFPIDILEASSARRRVASSSTSMDSCIAARSSGSSSNVASSSSSPAPSETRGSSSSSGSKRGRGRGSILCFFLGGFLDFDGDFRNDGSLA